MPFLPDWAPNAHPLVLHFPIALLYVAALLDLGGLLSGDRAHWRSTSSWLYVLGGIAAVATFLTGRAAADTVFLPVEANALLTEHSDLGMWTMWFFGGYGIVRLGWTLSGVATKIAARGLMFLLGVGGLVLLTITATHGAELVYRHGVGVQAVESGPSAPVIDKEAAGDHGIATAAAGWSWTPARAGLWKNEVEFLEGSADALHASLVDGGERGDVIQLDASEAVMFVFPGSIDRLQLDAVMDLSDFDGTVYVAHHVLEDGSYGFTSLGGGTMRLGKSENEDLLVQATEPFEATGWHDIRVVSDGTHYRSYADTRLVIHGHGSAFETGRVGLRLNGTGSVRIASMQAVDIGVAAAGGVAPQVDEAEDEDAGDDAAVGDTAAGEDAEHDH